MSWFSTGYAKVQEVGKRIDDALNQPYVPNFILRDGEDATITFLTNNPLNFYEHFLKGSNKSFTCSQSSDCPLCGVGNKPSFKGAYLIVDHREESWKDKNTGETKTRKDSVKIMKQGIRALQVLDRKNSRKGLGSRSWVVTRTGQGNNTQYDFEDVEPVIFVKPDKLPEIQTILKPRDREYILQQLAQTGRGAFTPPTHADEDDDVISFR